MRPRCFIIQEVLKKDLNTGQMVSVMDFRKVLEYGDPVICLPGGRIGLAPGPTIDRLKESLRDFTDDDYIVPVGDPTGMFIAAMVVGEMNRQKCNILKWDKDSKQYIKVQIDLNHHQKED